MTEKKKRLGFDPLKETPRGVDELIRQTTQDEQNTQYAQNPQKKAGDRGVKGKPLPRINMAFDPDNLHYLQIMAGFDRVSITRYVNRLIEEDLTRRVDIYGQIISIQEVKK